MPYKYDSLRPDQIDILQNKATEAPFSGEYIEAEATSGSYLCRGCGQALFREDSHFTSHCGWPSFDDQLPGTVAEHPDADGRRTEIVCSQCGGHLGHVFEGEGFTAKNRRHCVNSLSIEFVLDAQVHQSEEIILAAGCFWGVEHLLKQQDGVLKTEVGYIGGQQAYPTYEQVCGKNTGHVEAVRVVFDSERCDVATLIKAFFEIHDFSQSDGQGPDLGPQYLSRIYTFDAAQKQVAQQVMALLTDKGFSVATTLHDMAVFWPAEDYHQLYYDKTGKAPYCHSRRVIFSD